MDWLMLVLAWLALCIFSYGVTVLGWGKSSQEDLVFNHAASTSRLEKEQEVTGVQGGKSKSKFHPTNNNTNTNCVRCNKKLPNSTKGLKGVLVAPVPCSVCTLRVCKSCAVWDQSKNSYSCGHCHPPKSVDKRKNFWFDNISPTSSGSNFAAAERDKVTEDVREHLERIIETHVDEGIDVVPLSRLYQHSQYDLVFHRFHQELSDALVNLGYALKLAIENKPMNDTPTSAHTTLTELLEDIKEVARELPVMEPIMKTEADAAISKRERVVEPSYEDVLATAVINKAIINGQKSKRKADSPLSLVDSAVQTDSEMSENSDVHSQKNQYTDVRGWVTNLEKSGTQHHPNLSDDDLSMGTSSSNWSNDGNSKVPSQVVIEEQVEEITTTYESDSDISRAPPVRSRKGRKTARQRNNNESTTTTIITDDTLVGVNLGSFNDRVPFPEGGIDIVPRSKLDEDELEPTEEDPAGILVSQISEWEQNWLFKRRKQLLRKRNMMAESVPMLVPNPTEEGVEPQIGQEKITDLSDLSDHANEDEEQEFISTSDSGDEELAEEVSEDKVAAVKTVASDVAAVPLPVAGQPNSGARGSVSSVASSASDANSARRASNASTTSVKDSASDASTPSSVNKAKILPKAKAKKPEKPKLKFDSCPDDISIKAGLTARFKYTVSEDSPEFSVAWFHDGNLVTNSEGKTWVYSDGRNKHYLFIYDCKESDSGQYQISLFDYKGNETKYSASLNVTPFAGKKPTAPNFIKLQDTVSSIRGESVITIPFTVKGYPEPFLQVFKNNIEISKLSHVLLEDQGDGKWNLELRKDESEFSVYGEYVVIAKNSQGTSKVIFRVRDKESTIETVSEEKSEVDSGMDEKSSNDEKTDGNSVSPVPRPISVASEDSSIGETLRENSYTLNHNQTLIKEDYEAELVQQDPKFDPSKMTIAEREKKKWLNPVEISNNPYAPENLAKRIRQRESGNFSMPNNNADLVTSSDDDGPVLERKQNLNKFARDYYVPGLPTKSNQPSFKSSYNSGSSFGSSRSHSLTSNSSREGSNEKEGKISNSASSPNESSSSPVVPLKAIPEATPTVSATTLVKASSGKLKDSPENLSPHSPPTSRNSKLRTPSPTEGSRTPSPRPRRQKAADGSPLTPKTGTELKKIKLPSVKQLAQQFQKPDDTPKIAPENGTPINVTHKPFPREHKSYQQVHSLTARSVSRQFREGLKQAQPNKLDKNIKLRNADICNGKNEKNTNSNLEDNDEKHVNGGSREINSESAPGALNRKKGGSSSNILARAAFWDKRVTEGIIDDELVINEFPPMDV